MIAPYSFLLRKPDAERRRTGREYLVPLAALYAVLLMVVAGLVVVSIPPQEIELPAPAVQAGKILLTVESGGRSMPFDMRALQALPQHTHKVHTPWYQRPVSFQGPLLRDVLAAADASGTRITAVAVNDFTAEIPVSDVAEYDVILALRMDGKPLAARDKGPLFMIYPYDSLPAEQRGRYFDISVWQLDVLRVQ